MTKLQTSLVAEETWVDGAAEKLASLPTATSAYELDVSISFVAINTIKNTLKYFYLLNVLLFENTNIFLDFRNHFLLIFFLLSYISRYSYHSLVYQNLLFDICFVSMNLCVNTTFY